MPRRILGYLVAKDGLDLVDHQGRRFLRNFENRVRARFWFDIEPIVVDVPCLDHGASDGAGEGGKVDQLADRAAAHVRGDVKDHFADVVIGNRHFLFEPFRDQPARGVVESQINALVHQSPVTLAAIEADLNALDDGFRAKRNR